jgi:hypothetical protein
MYKPMTNEYPPPVLSKQCYLVLMRTARVMFQELLDSIHMFRLDACYGLYLS